MSGREFQLCLQINRYWPQAGKVRLLDNFTGRFAQLLPPERPKAEVREQARALLAAMGVTEDRLRGNAGWN